tara:strand:- start:669 stop:1229 length:561 start_codon:yes stop_codon:yes gene_type:complete
MFEIKRSKLSWAFVILFIGIFLAVYIWDFTDDSFALADGMNEELGSPFGVLLYWAFFLMLLIGLYLGGKQLISNDPVITFDTNEIKFHSPLLKKHNLTLQWKEIEKIQLGYQNVPYGGGKQQYLVITPFNEEAAKKYNSYRIKEEQFISSGVSWDMKKRIGIHINGLQLKPKEILVHAKKFLTENS